MGKKNFVFMFIFNFLFYKVIIPRLLTFRKIYLTNVHNNSNISKQVTKISICFVTLPCNGRRGVLFYLSLQKLPTQIFIEFFYGIPQHGPGHLGVMFQQKSHCCFFVPFSNFSEHSSHRLMNQVVMMMQQYFGNFERVVELAATNKIQRGNK